VGQNLTALNINLSILRSQLPAQVLEKAGSRLSDSVQLVEETTERIRDVMADLRPEVLDDYGLAAALRWYGERFSERTGIATTVQGTEPSPRMPEMVESAFFRIAQEALTNVAKHAGGKQVSVEFEEGDETFRLTIADDGRGFDPEALGGSEKKKGWGFLTMQERAQAVGGKLHVESNSGKGTRVTVEMQRKKG
jgi:signal transduction histidine kinase